jgi:hypothetical protein
MMSKEIKVGDWVRVMKDAPSLGGHYAVIKIYDELPSSPKLYALDVSDDDDFLGIDIWLCKEEDIEPLYDRCSATDVEFSGYIWCDVTKDFQERYNELVKELEITDKLNAFLKDIIEQQAEIIEYLLQQR